MLDYPYLYYWRNIIKWLLLMCYKKVDKINRGVSPIQDAEIERFLKEKHLNLIATRNAQEAYKDAEFVIISTPTNYDPVLNHFDTSSVESVIQLVKK